MADTRTVDGAYVESAYAPQSKPTIDGALVDVLWRPRSEPMLDLAYIEVLYLPAPAGYIGWGMPLI